MDFDKAFSNGKWAKTVSTVGEAIEELKRLPPDMPVQQGFADCVDLVVFNRDKPDMHCSFEEGGDWDEDDDPQSDNFYSLGA